MRVSRSTLIATGILASAIAATCAVAIAVGARRSHHVSVELSSASKGGPSAELNGQIVGLSAYLGEHDQSTERFNAKVALHA